MIIWHAPTEPPKEGRKLIVLCDDGHGSPSPKMARFKKDDFQGIYGGRLDNVLAWTEYNMPEWVERKDK